MTPARLQPLTELPQLCVGVYLSQLREGIVSGALKPGTLLHGRTETGAA
jgi:hypothetical protein